MRSAPVPDRSNDEALLKMVTKALLLENLHADADEALATFAPVDVTRLSGSPDRTELLEAVARAQLLGIRSRTRVDEELLAAASELLAVGCFCIGTNQVDLEACAERGIPVFNAPFANTRSVAELTIASIVMLMRGIPEKMQKIRAGEWLKSADGSHEVRKKRLGIIGYGNIGSQLSVIASAMGMHVYFYDLEPKLAHGNAREVTGLDELLAKSDVVTLHVPSTDKTRWMIDEAAIGSMKPGAFLINHARGDLVDIDALAAALREGHLAGAAVDVFPVEPKQKDQPFESPLLEFDNVILTPHIGGSTVEAQAAIGRDAASKLARFVFEGSTSHAVNFPQVEPGALAAGRSRLTCAHRNEPGFLSKLNEAVSATGGNIAAQSLQTQGDLGYVVADVEVGPARGDQILAAVRGLSGTLRARMLSHAP